MYGAIFAIFYFILIRPQANQRKKHDEMVRNLKKGDEIVTTGGLIGEVLFIKEKGGDDKSSGLEDRVTIKSGDTRVIIERGRIAKITRPVSTSSVSAGSAFWTSGCWVTRFFASRQSPSPKSPTSCAS